MPETSTSPNPHQHSRNLSLTSACPPVTSSSPSLKSNFFPFLPSSTSNGASNGNVKGEVGLGIGGIESVSMSTSSTNNVGGKTEKRKSWKNSPSPWLPTPLESTSSTSTSSTSSSTTPPIPEVNILPVSPYALSFPNSSTSHSREPSGSSSSAHRHSGSSQSRRSSSGTLVVGSGTGGMIIDANGAMSSSPEEDLFPHSQVVLLPSSNSTSLDSPMLVHSPSLRSGSLKTKLSTSPKLEIDTSVVSSPNISGSSRRMGGSLRSPLGTSTTGQSIPILILSIIFSLPSIIHSIVFPSSHTPSPSTHTRHHSKDLRRFSVPSTSGSSGRSGIFRMLTIGYVVFSLVYTTGRVVRGNGVSTGSWRQVRELEAKRGAGEEVVFQPMPVPIAIPSDNLEEVGNASGLGVVEDGVGMVGLEEVLGTSAGVGDVEGQGVGRIEVMRQVQVVEGDDSSHPMNWFSLTENSDYVFSKLHSKIFGNRQTSFGNKILPYAFPAAYTKSTSSIASAGEVSAVVFANAATLSHLPEFVIKWDGPVSLVFQDYDTNESAVKSTITRLREDHPKLKKWVDWHVIIDNSLSSSEVGTGDKRDREDGRIKNWQVNFGRMWARTEMVWIIGDLQGSLPGGERGGLRKKFNEEVVREVVLGRGDMVVVPKFRVIGYEEELELPVKKGGVVDLLREGRVRLEEDMDRDGDESYKTIEENPINLELWKKLKNDKTLYNDPKVGGGKNLGVPTDEGSPTVGGGKNLYKLANYDFHFSPSNILMSKKGVPWCTERFERNWKACVYQGWLSGGEIYAMPEGWIWGIGEITSSVVEGGMTEPEKIKKTISNKLYNKFHQEACMHYGREILSLGIWDGEKARHLRTSCARVFSSWGVGLVSNVAKE